MNGIRLLGMAVVLAFATQGCGACSAVVNPKVSWALSERPPLEVVVRRAEVAMSVAHRCDTLLVGTAVAPDWKANKPLTQQEYERLMQSVQQIPVYTQSNARIVAAEVWALALWERSDGGETGKAPAANSASVLGMLDPALAERFALIVDAERRLIDMRARLADERAKEQPTPIGRGTQVIKTSSPADELAREIDTLSGQLSNTQSGFAEAVRRTASRATPDFQQRTGILVQMVKQAVEDARRATEVASVGYKQAAGSVNQALATPALSASEPAGGPKSHEDWGARVRKTKHVIAGAKAMLDFDADVANALLEGYARAGWMAPPPPVIPDPVR